MSNDSLTRAHIVGDVLDPFASSVPLTVMYDGRPVFNGMEFRSPAVTLKPRVEIGGDDFRVAYTLVSPSLCTRKITPLMVAICV
jgi:protein FLOWERING LOCUS T